MGELNKRLMIQGGDLSDQPKELKLNMVRLQSGNPLRPKRQGRKPQAPIVGPYIKKVLLWERGREREPPFLPSSLSPFRSPATHCAFTTRRLLFPLWRAQFSTFEVARLPMAAITQPFMDRHAITVLLCRLRSVLRFTSNDDKSRKGSSFAFGL